MLVRHLSCPLPPHCVIIVTHLGRRFLRWETNCIASSCSSSAVAFVLRFYEFCDSKVISGAALREINVCPACNLNVETQTFYGGAQKEDQKHVSHPSNLMRLWTSKKHGKMFSKLTLGKYHLKSRQTIKGTKNQPSALQFLAPGASRMTEPSLLGL